MSAPPGYNANESMLPDAGGAIRAMQGGFLASPYTGGVTETTSLLKDVPAASAPITNYSGGGPLATNSNALPIAIASSVAAANNAAPVAPVAPIAPIAPVNAVEPVVPAEAIAVASDAVASSTASSTASNVASNVVPVVATNAAPSAVAPISSSSVSVPVKDIAPITPATNSKNTKTVATAVNVTTSSTDELEDKEKKPIKVFGKEYIVTNPSLDLEDKNWNDAMAVLGFDALPSDKQKELKNMIYEDSTCVEEDLPISTSIKCEPMRKMIAMIAEELLKQGLPNERPGTTVHVDFKPEEQVKELSTVTLGLKVAENTSDKSKEETPKEEPLKEEAPKEEKSEEKKSTGGLREKKRRTIRKRK